MVNGPGLVVFVEGGARGSLAAEARQGFKRFLENGFLSSVRPSVIACGSRNEAFDRFRQAVSGGQNCILLVDSEAVPTSSCPAWQQPHIAKMDRWAKPRHSSDDDLHFMAPTMEAWLVACESELAAFFGQGFRPQRLPQAPNLETVPKSRIYASLKAATKDTAKGPYSKASHSFELLGRCKPNTVQVRCPDWGKRFLAELRKRGCR